MADDTERAEEIKTFRVALYIIGGLVLICLAHAGIKDLKEWRTPAVIAPAAAAPLAYTCGAPDDMGFTKCRRQSP